MRVCIEPPRTLFGVFLAFLLLGLSGPGEVIAQENVSGSRRSLPEVSVEVSERDRPVLERKVALRLDRVPLAIALDALARNGVDLAYQTEIIANRGVVSCDCRDVTGREALQQILGPAGLEYEVMPSGEVVVHERPVAEVEEFGILRGQIVDQSTGQGVDGVQVTVLGTELQTLTSGNGNYNLVQVPVGAQRIRAERLGYHTVEQDVTVTGSEVTVVNLTMGIDPVRLNPLEASVSTGTLIDTEKRALGTSISVVSEAEIRESGATDLMQLLRGRLPGVTSYSTSGLSGSGGHIQIRGVSSLMQDQAPLVYVDGVPIDNSSWALNNRTSSSVTSDFGAHIRLDEIPLDQIERIEVVKGPAATTLYGSEASNGVIQIFTKRGIAGPTRVVVSVEEGTSSVNHGDSFVELSPYGNRMRSLFRDPRQSRYNANVSGGQGSLTYNIGVSRHSNEGVALDNGEDQTSLHVSFGRQSDDNFSLRVSGNFVQRSFLNRNYQGLFSFVDAGPEHPVQYGSLEEAIRRLDRTETDLRRVYGSVDLTWRPFDTWQNSLTIGIDQSLEENETLSSTTFDDKYRRRRVTKDFDRISARYLSSLSYPQSGPVTSVLSFGAEARRDGVLQVALQADGLPTADVSGFPYADQTMIASEASSAIGIIGFFAQEQVTIHDKLFLTAGVRADGSSTFGDDFGLQLYPKLSAAYVIEPTPWWITKVRAAWGRSGQLPEPFAHEMTFGLDRNFYTGVPQLKLDDLGNKNLKAEVGSEFEIGVEQYLFGNRASVEFNYFRQVTRDAMLRADVSPFFGVPSGPLMNIGGLRSQGIELIGQATAIDQPDLSLRVGFNLTHMIENGVVTHLGGDLEQLQGFSDQGWMLLGGIEVGRTMRDLHFLSFINNFRRDLPVFDNHVYLGSTVPTTYGGFNTDLQLYKDFRLSSFWSYALGGHGLDWNRVTRDVNARLLSSNSSFQPEVVKARYLFRTDHLRFDALRATYTLPAGLLGGFANNAEVWAEGRNLALFDLWPNADPSTVTVEGSRSAIAYGVNQYSVPQPRSYVFGLRVVF